MKATRPVKLVLLTLSVALIFACFQLFEFVTSPLHEAGHIIACLLLGGSVTGIEWTRVHLMVPNNWQGQLVVSLAGGLFASLVLLLLYLMMPKYPGEGKLRTFLLFCLRVFLLAGSANQLINGLVEGFLPSFYMYAHDMSVPIVQTCLSAVPFSLAYLHERRLVMRQMPRE